MGGSTTTTQKSDPWAPAQDSLKKVLAGADQLYETGGMSPAPYSGDRVAGFGDVTQAAHQGIVDKASGGSPLLDQMGGTLSSMMDGNYQNDRLESVKQNALGSAVPAAVSMFSGSGMTDSSTAMDYTGRAAAEAVAPIEYQAAEAAQNRALQAAGMAPTAYSASYLPEQMLSKVGAQQDALSQLETDAGMASYYESQGQDLDALKQYASLAAAIGGMGGTSSATEKKKTGLGGLFDIAGAGLSLFSDRRLKENIQHIGHTKGGHRLYSYTYKGGNIPQVGVMADEVPHAVVGKIGVFSVVDYGRIS